MAYWREVERSRGALVHQLHDYWTSKLNGRPMPARADIDPGEIKHLLPNMLIMDIAAEPFRVRYRLLGTKVVSASGSDFTGRYLDEMVAADVENEWEECYRLVCREKRPLFGRATVPTQGGGSFTYDYGLFPLSSDGDTVTQCAAIEDYGALNDKLFELQEKSQPWQPRTIVLKPGRDG